MIYKDKKLNLFMIMPILLMFVLLFDFSFAFFNKTINTSKIISVKSGTKYIGIYGDNKNNVELGKTYSFTIENRGSILSGYELYLDSDSTNSILSTSVNYTVAGDISSNGTLSSTKLFSSCLGLGDINKITITLSSSSTGTFKGKLRIKYTSYSLVKNYGYTGTSQTFTVPVTATYKIQLWGAKGGTTNGGIGGKGAYTVGNVKLEKDKKIYVYVGEDFEGYRETSCFNGGGHGGYGNVETNYDANGGGATDIRLASGDWKNFDSLKSRIMVASGGGGGGYYYNGTFNGGAGGTLAGFAGTTHAASTQTGGVAPPGGTQTSPGTAAGFGVGGEVGIFTSNYYYYSGGGGGYYGGSVGNAVAGGIVAGAAGGSSFISGYPGCNAISESSTSTNIVHTGGAIHYSGYTFTSSTMIGGNSSMPNTAGTGNETGHSGNGYAKITFVS